MDSRNGNSHDEYPNFKTVTSVTSNEDDNHDSFNLLSSSVLTPSTALRTGSSSLTENKTSATNDECYNEGMTTRMNPLLNNQQLQDQQERKKEEPQLLEREEVQQQQQQQSSNFCDDQQFSSSDSTLPNFFSTTSCQDAFLSQRTAAILNVTSDAAESEATWKLRRSAVIGTSIISNSNNNNISSNVRRYSHKLSDQSNSSETADEVRSGKEFSRRQEDTSLDATLIRANPVSSVDHEHLNEDDFIQQEKTLLRQEVVSGVISFGHNSFDSPEASGHLDDKISINSDIGSVLLDDSIRNDQALVFQQVHDSTDNKTDAYEERNHTPDLQQQQLPNPTSPQVSLIDMDDSPVQQHLSEHDVSSLESKVPRPLLLPHPHQVPQRQRTSSSSKINMYNLYASMSISQILKGNNILRSAPASEKQENVPNSESSVEVQMQSEDESWLLHSIFDGFCTPPIPLESISSILKMERTRNYEEKCNNNNVPLPEQPVIIQQSAPESSSEKKSNDNIVKHSPVVSMLQPGVNNKTTLPVLLQLPIHFTAAFLRILIRILSHESDIEYNEACFLTHPWKGRKKDNASTISDNMNLNENPAPDRDHATQRPHLQYSVARFQCTWLSAAQQSDNDNLITITSDERPAIQAVLNLWERATTAPSPYHRLLAPLSRLIGLLSTAGITPKILRRIMTLVTLPSSTQQQQQQQQQQQPAPLVTSQQQQPEQQQQKGGGNSVYSRLCLIRALKTAATGASRPSLLTKSVPSHYFSFGGGCTGMQRTINGLSVWPFRNDFGMALWFRAESFSSASSRMSLMDGVRENNRIVLFSVRTDEGGGIEISLVPIDDNDSNSASSSTSPVRTIAVSVYDSNYNSPAEKLDKEKATSTTPTHYLKARGGCVLLPQVWYHVAVRHTRSRLKGVFSLATRQQLSIMLDGKTMLTESLNFPNISDGDNAPADDSSSYYSAQVAASSLLFRRSTAVPSTLNITLRFGQNFEGQTGAIYIFNDNVSDASFRSLYEATGGCAGGILKRTHSLGDTWDARRSEIVRKSRVLDVNLSNEDADEIVLSNRRYPKRNMPVKDKLLSVIDLGEGDDPQQDDMQLPADLQKSAFGSKIFLSWNPQRSMGPLAIELHVGAHVRMRDVQSWKSNSVQDVISSLGGIQSLIPLFRSLLSADSERGWALPNAIEATSDTDVNYSVYTIMPDLISLLSSFVQDHGDNARELLRCGGIDVIEQLFYSCRKNASGKGRGSSIFGAISCHHGLAQLLVDTLLALRSACSHYLGLETKVYTRLVFNIPLWLGGFQQIPGVAIHVTLLPLLSYLTKLNPEKVRDCVGVKDMVQALKEYSSGVEIQKSETERLDLDRFQSYDFDNNLIEKSLSPVERRQATNFLFAMIFSVASLGTSHTDLSPFLHLISNCLESEWEDFLIKDDREDLSAVKTPDECRIVARACSVLLFLLQIRPCVPGLYENFAHCCGGVQGGAAWILCAMVNSHDDEIRGLGIRCLAAYLDETSRGADAPLSLGSVMYPSGIPTQAAADVSSMVRRSSQRFTQIAKGFASMSPAVRSIVLPPSKLTTRVVYKLLWHLLKGRRTQLGRKTRAALISWITFEEGLSSELSSLNSLQTHLLVPFQSYQPGFTFAMEWAQEVLLDSSVSLGKTLRNPLAVSTILRLLRFFDSDLKDQWLSDILFLTGSNRKCISLLASLPDWQPCLFPLISDTLELVSNDTLADIDNNTDPLAADNHRATTSKMPKRELLHKRLDRCLNLYSTLLGHLVREGGDQALEAVERTASLERTCVNGRDVSLLILSGLCSNIFEFGSLLEMGSLSAQDWKGVDLEQESPLLKQSARLVTDAILSNGLKGLDMPAAVRSWRGLRHLTEVIVAVITKSGFGVVDLFDYAYQQASSIDPVSGGLHGIRLPEAKLTGVGASDYALYLRGRGSIGAFSDNDIRDKKREVDRRLCLMLSAQILNLLDAFIFPHSLDESLPMSHMHSLALVRNSEVRLGVSQGPLISSAIRLSLLLLALLEPCSVIFLQCAGRLRCLLHWALELLRESNSSDGSVPPYHKDGAAHLDRLLLSVVLHSHRALGRCSSLLSEIESSSYSKYFQTRDMQKKVYRRLFRVGLELREVVSTAYRGRNDVLRSTLSSDAFEALRSSLEGYSSVIKPTSKESVVRDFLHSTWVSGFQDCETKAGLVIPEQVSMYSIPLSSNQQNQPGLEGFVAFEKLALESSNVVSDFEKAVDSCFKEYLIEHQRWTETNAVRDLEYEGDTTIKLFSEKHKIETNEAAKVVFLRRGGADNRWKSIQRKVTDPWKNETHWKLARYTDILGRRTVLVQNRDFNDHKDASYDLTLGKEKEKVNNKLNQLEKRELSDVMRRHAEAFIVADKQSSDGKDDDSSMVLTSDSDSVNTDAESSVDASVDINSPGDPRENNIINTITEDVEQDEGWDKIDTAEIRDFNAEGDIDAWAKTFIWSENETIVSRFEPIMIVSLQTLVEGKALLTTHGLYFHQIGDEINVMTKEPVESNESVGLDGKCRRWRLTRLTEIHGRRFMLRSQALELFFSDSHELLLNFPGGVKQRDLFHAKLRHTCKVPMLWSNRSLNPRFVFKKSKLTEQWKRRKLSNFEYLMALNRMAGRSFNDLTQYPVFPWIIADYTSESIDLTDARVFRDLSKPVGALNPDRLAQLLERYKDLELFGFTEAERFIYGSHYSSPGIVLHYLIRHEPFTSMAVDLQSGRFDCPDRLFYDVSASWNSCLTSTSDMKELIPEFFTLPEMFLNTNRFPLGTTQNGRVVDNVGLPPWAKGSAYEFVRINRLALESEYVSQNLHHWIDLIFGYKQRGEQAIRSHNIFHHLSYEGSVDLDKIADEIDRTAAETHIQNFGQTPSQLLVFDPHPSRQSADDSWRPLLSDPSSSRNLRCFTPAKQFANKRTEDAKGAALKINVFSDSVLVIYEDLSVATYKWFPTYKNNRLRMDKLRTLARRELSVSRVAMKRGSTLPVDLVSKSSIRIGNWSFGVTLGGLVKEELRRKAVMPSGRLISTSEASLTAAEASALIISCGYWDETVKSHCADSLRLVASESGGHRGPIRCLAMGQDGGLMVTGGQDCTCRVWVVDHPDMAVALSDGYVQTALGGAHDGEQILSCCHVLWGHDSPISSIAMDSDLNVVVSGGQNGLVCIHTIRRGDFVRSFRIPPMTTKGTSGLVSKMVMGVNGYVVIQMEDYGLHTYTVNAVRLCTVDAGELLSDMVISSTGEMLVTGGDRGQVLIRDVSHLQVRATLDLSRHGSIKCISLTPVDLNPIGQYLFIGSENGMISVAENDPLNNQNDNQTISF